MLFVQRPPFKALKPKVILMKRVKPCSRGVPKLHSRHVKFTIKIVLDAVRVMGRMMVESSSNGLSWLQHWWGAMELIWPMDQGTGEMNQMSKI